MMYTVRYVGAGVETFPKVFQNCQMRLESRDMAGAFSSGRRWFGEIELIPGFTACMHFL
jgi:hypothetical protein